MVKLILSCFRYTLFGFLIVLFYACSGPKVPDVSKISVNLKVHRFEKDFFSSDTSDITGSLYALTQKYPYFIPNFLSEVLNVDPRWPADTTARYIKQFMEAYRPVYDTAEKIYSSFTQPEKEIKQALQFLKYYFPAYDAPENIVTYIGPLDGYGDILDKDVAYVGLQHHLGKTYSLYSTPLVQETYPGYITQRFEPITISVNLMKNIVSDMYPEAFEDRALIIQMVEKGKRLYLLQQLLPYMKEYLLIGYSEEQMKECYAHERSIWDLFIQNNLLQSTDYGLIRNYVGESPKTVELGDASPGNIGSFAGWQIVKHYMNSHSNLTPKQVMATSAEKIFHDAKYKP